MLKLFTKRMRVGQRGFTLVELMVVMGILAILAAIVFPAVSGVGATGRSTAKVADVSTVQRAVDNYIGQAPNARYPTSVTGYEGGLPTGDGVYPIDWDAAFTDDATFKAQYVASVASANLTATTAQIAAAKAAAKAAAINAGATSSEADNIVNAYAAATSGANITITETAVYNVSITSDSPDLYVAAITAKEAVCITIAYGEALGVEAKILVPSFLKQEPSHSRETITGARWYAATSGADAYWVLDKDGIVRCQIADMSY